MNRKAFIFALLVLAVLFVMMFFPLFDLTIGDWQ